ncbi:HNH endonuclease [Rathayibacter soli]|uniref:HNH endonuclease n=1 Tax=Rathayibacter soli TaxID=3144168 RepID=UPI0027E4D64E|nr:DUF222 domain-containing protein [Glaciibacter superstes]
MDNPTAALENMIDAASTIDSSALWAMSADDLLLITARAEEAGRVIDALRVATATEVDKRSDPAFGSNGLAATRGCRNSVELLERVTAAASGTIRRRLRLGATALPRTSATGAALPALFSTVGAAFTAGRIGLDTAEAITRELSTASPRAAIDDLLVAERLLVAAATGQQFMQEDGEAVASETAIPSETGVAGMAGMAGIPLPADLIRIQARAWRDALDPDGVEPSAEEALQRRDFWMSRTAKNGVHPFGGAVTPEIAAITLAVLEAVVTPRTAPKFLEKEENEERGIAADPRTAGQQKADLFAAMVKSFGASQEFSTPPTVLITAKADTLNPDTLDPSALDPDTLDPSALDRDAPYGTGKISGIEDPIPASVVRQFVCDGGVQSVILGPGGRIIKLGSKSRYFTKAQRRAMAARDGLTCIVPGCPIPATASEAHHVVPDHRGGPTHVDNGVLACWWHHRMLDTGIWTVTMHHGTPTIHPPNWLAQLARTPRQSQTPLMRT